MRTVLAVGCGILFIPISVAMAEPVVEATWIIAASPVVLRHGEPVMLEIVRPAGVMAWPESLQARIQGDAVAETVRLTPVESAAEFGGFRHYRFDLPARGNGLLQIELDGLKSNRVLLNVVADGDPPAPALFDDASGTPERFEPMPASEPALSALEPVYLLAGLNHGWDARFQLSFKYRLFDAEALPVQWMPALGKLHVGYTQTSIWDLDEESKPFHDTSYRPSIFWQSRLDERSFSPSYLRTGYEHESNGKGLPDSRSIDIYYVQPVLRRDFADGNSLFFAPRIYTYLNRNENSDIARYRGYFDWQGRYGRENGWMLMGRVRTGTSGYGSVQLDYTTPLRKPLFARTGGFIHLQLFSGYGESLIDYNVRSPFQLRIGYSIVR